MKRYLVERELIQNNIQVLQKKAGSAVIWAVLKGNGYGLGLLPMAETCRAAGLDHFAVTEIAEARALREAGIEPGMAHILNSSGVLHFSGAAMDAVRVGSALLGRVHGGHGLKRVGYCETQVEELKWLPKGHTTGYGAGWKAKRPTRVAILPVGWYNGFGCEMGNDLFRFRDCLRRIAASLRTMLFGKAYYVTINGKRCKVLGHIGMLHTAADVSGIQCSLGDMARVEINPLMQKGMDVEWR